MLDTIYQNRIKDNQQKLSFLTKKLSRIVIARVGAFLFLSLIIFLSIYFDKPSYLWLIITPIIAFFAFIKLNQKLKRRHNLTEAIITLDEREIKVLNGDFSAFENGKEHQQPNHDYAHDLDVFGEKSIFQYLNRTSSKESEAKLAHHLSDFNTSNTTIKAKQEAIKELTHQIEWRQLFLANGTLFKRNKKTHKDLFNWLNTGINEMNSNSIWLVTLWGIPLLTLFPTILLAMGLIKIQLFLLYLIIPLAVVGRKLALINFHHKASSVYTDILKKNGVLTGLIEQHSFQSDKLQHIKHQLVNEDIIASEEIDKLAKIVQNLDNRSNPLFAFLANALLLWDLQFLFKLKKWMAKNGSQVEKWFDGVYEIESYLSFSTFAFNNHSYVYPTLTEDNLLTATDLGHPLIANNNRVNNDYTINNLHEFTIITGANMAGKSTFLRSVGINLILAMNGMPVCAKSFAFKPIKLFTSMRTADSLSDSESYFYAELKRLKAIVDKLKDGEVLFVILDEILKGTNSKDKAEGSKKFVAQLIQYPLTGIIATHDLSLCTLADTYPNNITNQYFDVELLEDDLVFDYKLKNGVCSNMNAEYLMKKMGITD